MSDILNDKKIESIPDSIALEKINRYTRRTFNANEVYVFSMKLCDNEIDCDNERFSIDALCKLSKLFIGKTGVIRTNQQNNDYTARIYDCRVGTKDTVITSYNEPYTYLIADTYIPIVDVNKGIIEELKHGIIKDVSIGCAIANLSCSICGTDLKNSQCNHVQGNIYTGKTCCRVLNNPTDAYEWSFTIKPKYKVKLRRVNNIND